MPITNESTYITVSYVGGDAKGDSFTNPYTFQDIYDADVAGGWGFISKQGSYQYLITKSIIINPLTYFYAYGEQVVFDVPAEMYSYCIFVNGYGQFGEDGANKDITSFKSVGSRTGILFQGRSFGYNLTLDGHYLRLNGQFPDEPVLLKNVGVINKSQAFVVASANLIADNCWSINSYFCLDLRAAGTITRMKVFGATTPAFIYIGAQEITFTDLDIQDDQYTVKNLFGIQDNSSIANFIDSKISGIYFGRYGELDGDATANHKSTFTTNMNSDSVTLYDVNDNIVFTGSAMTAEPITYLQDVGYKLSGSATIYSSQNTLQPFKLVATKEGFSDITIEDIEVVVGDPTVLRATFEEPIYYQYSVDGEIKTDKISGEVILNSIAGEVTTTHVVAGQVENE